MTMLTKCGRNSWLLGSGENRYFAIILLGREYFLIEHTDRQINKQTKYSITRLNDDDNDDVGDDVDDDDDSFVSDNILIEICAMC